MIVQWFTDSPAAGDPACLCSFCGRCIPALDEEAAPTIMRVVDQTSGLEVRACQGCEGAYWNFTANPTRPTPT